MTDTKPKAEEVKPEEVKAKDKPTVAEQQAAVNPDNIGIDGLELEQVSTTELYNANDGVHGRDGGPYLDQVEAIHWEKVHAAREGSEPNLENPRPYPGILLRTKGAQIANFNPLLIGGDDRRDDSDFTAIPVVEDHPVFAPVGAANEGDQPLSDNPAENNVSAAVEKFSL